jgi:hypothetical protein
MAEDTTLKVVSCGFESHRAHMDLFEQDLDTNEFWCQGNALMFTYVAKPTPYIKYILEGYYGPLDWNIPYV